MSFILKLLKAPDHKDLSQHRVHTTLYEDLCM